MTDTFPLHFWNKKSLLPILGDSLSRVHELTIKMFGIPQEISACPLPKDDIFTTPKVLRIMNEKGITSQGYCKVCDTFIPESRRTEDCPTCSLALLYEEPKIHGKSADEIEKLVYRSLFSETEKSVSQMNDKELNSFIMNLTEIQNIIDKARKANRAKLSVAEREIIKRSPAKRVKAGAAAGTEGDGQLISKQGPKLTKEEKLQAKLTELNIDFSDLF